MPRTQSNKDELMSRNFRQNLALAMVLALGAAVSLGVLVALLQKPISLSE